MTRSVPSGADVITIPSTPSRGFWRPFLPEIVLFVLVSAVYYASNFTISGSVEGSHYSITRAIVEERRFAVDSYWRDFGPLDVAANKGHYYANREPGVGFLGVPFYAVGLAVGKLISPTPETVGRHMVTVLLVSVGALGVIVLIHLMIRLGVSRQSAWVMGLTYAFATLHWKYSAHLFDHVFVELGLLLCWYLLVTGVDLFSYSRRSAVFCLVIGWLPVLRFPSVIIVVAALIHLFLSADRRPLPRGREERVALLDNGLLVVVPMALLFYYQTVCFGAPWTTYARFSAAEFLHGWNTAFDTPLARGVGTLLFNVPGGYPYGLFVLSPILLVGVLGWPVYYRARPKDALLQGLVMILWLTVFAKYHDFGGGSTGDARYLSVLTPLLLIPAGHALDFVSHRVRDAGLRALALLPFAVLACVSFLACFVHMAEYFGHDLDFHRDITHFSLLSDSGWHAIVGRAFPSIGRLHWYLATVLVVGLLFRGGRAFGRLGGPRRHPATSAQIPAGNLTLPGSRRDAG